MGTIDPRRLEELKNLVETTDKIEIKNLDELSEVKRLVDERNRIKTPIVYSNDKYGLSIKCPKGWRMVKTFFPPDMLVQFVDLKGGGINLVAGPIPGIQESIDDLENLARDNVHRLNGILESLKHIKVDNIDSVEAVYTALGLKTKKVGLVRNRIEYIITCSINPILFDEYNPIFDECIQSLKFKQEQEIRKYD
jgi:hypothetical protein